MKENDSNQFTPPDFARGVKFYLTSPAPCPYLPDRQERKVFANLAVDGSTPLNDSLTRNGFRRSQTIAYRPACKGCSACLSVRIDVEKFNWSRRWRKLENKNSDLIRTPTRAVATREQFRLLKKYLNHRHEDGGMNDMEIRDYAGMVDASPVKTVVFEYREPPLYNSDHGVLTAAALTDVLRDGLSMVYSFFTPTAPKRSLGAYMILSHVRLAEELGLPYVYLGYWVKGSHKMDYKADFKPLEVFNGAEWTPLADKG